MRGAIPLVLAGFTAIRFALRSLTTAELWPANAAITRRVGPVIVCLVDGEVRLEKAATAVSWPLFSAAMERGKMRKE